MFVKFVAKAGVVMSVLLVACGPGAELTEKERVTNQVDDLEQVLNGSFVLLPRSVGDCEVVADSLVGAEVPGELWRESVVSSVLHVKRVTFVSADSVCSGTAVLEATGPHHVVFTAVTFTPGSVWCYVSGSQKWSNYASGVTKRGLGSRPWVAVECDHLWSDSVAHMVADRGVLERSLLSDPPLAGDSED